MNKILRVSSRLVLFFCVGVSMASFAGRGKYARDYKKEDVLSQDTRNSIYELIKSNEGLHFRKICRLLDKKMGVVQYHVSVLEKSGMIRAIRDGRYKCFFATDATKTAQIAHDDRNKEEEALRETIVTSLRRRTPQMLISHLAREGMASHQTLSEVAGVSPQAITFHTQRLAAFNIILAQKDGRQKFYALTPNAEAVMHDLKILR